MDTTVRVVVKAASVIVSHYKELKPALFQEFSLPLALLPEWGHSCFSSQKIVLQTNHQELLLQEHLGPAFQHTCGSDCFLSGVIEAEYLGI